MILNAEQAAEIGEALIDAAEAARNSENSQSVMVVDQVVVAVPADTLIDDWEHIAYVSKS